MIEPPVITTCIAQQTAVIHMTIPRSEIQNVMGPALGELMQVLAAQGIKPTGPWLNHHLRMPSDSFDFELSMPVDKPVKPQGRVKPGQLAATKVARTVYRGPYEGLGGAWGEFGKWIASQGIKTGPNLWEVYLAGPESGPDPSKWQTQLNRPVIG